MTINRNPKVKSGLGQFIILLVTIVIPLTLLHTGCKKFVQIPPPNNLITQPVVFNNDAAATGAMTSIYSQMFSNNESPYMAIQCGMQADELRSYSSDQLLQQYYSNRLLATNITLNSGSWPFFYNYIYQANAVLNGLANISGTTAAPRQQLTGEAKFLRAFCYFYLVNCYGDVPLVTSVEYQSNDHLPRSPSSQVYTQIVADLQDARNLLNSTFVDGTDTAMTTDRVRPSKAAATALLARVYLYEKKYDSAALMASQVIADSRFSLSPDLTQTFLSTSTEAIWQLMTPSPNPVGSSNNATSDGNLFILNSAPRGNARGFTSLSSWLLSSFEPNDLRRSLWVDSIIVSSPADTFYFPYKYEIGYSSPNPNNRIEYTTVLRLAEQYLIRAEAEAQLGTDLSAAAADLNVIRTRAGLPNYAGPLQKDALLSAILHERQVELFTEWGHRWFDLIRMNAVDTVMGAPGNICQQKGGIWNHDWTLRPIPQSEILRDGSLTQNAGY